MFGIVDSVEFILSEFIMSWIMLLFGDVSRDASPITHSHLPNDGRSISRNVAKNNMIQDMINSDNIIFDVL